MTCVTHGSSHPIASATDFDALVTAVPVRQIRASYTVSCVDVYQAYSAEIAEGAVRAQSFVSPFSRARMTWIKPSFAWMMYRSGWATKPGQERILRIRLRRVWFDWALAHSSLSSFIPGHHGSADEWARALRASPVRVQWDPERTLLLEPLPWRTIQVGIGSTAVDAFCEEWIGSIEDVTPVATKVMESVKAGDLAAARGLLLPETEYPVDPQTAIRLGAHGK